MAATPVVRGGQLGDRCSGSTSGPDAGGGGAGVYELFWLRGRVVNKTLRKAVDAALARVAAAAGMTPGQLVERAVPDLGLGADGSAEVPVGPYTALLQLTGSATTATLAMTWRTPTGSAVKSVPTAVKDGHPEALAELRALAKQTKQAVAAQRARLEDLLAADRHWTGAAWVTLYLDQPVVGRTARGLLWQARTPSSGGGQTSDKESIWRSGLPEHHLAPEAVGGWALRDYDGTLAEVRADDEVRLWHPVQQSLAEVRAWRAHLSDQAVRQPFKQAFREIYLLTPAEEATGTYSNRFAAHVLRYPQAGALMGTRGWSASHLGYWDGGFEGSATRVLGEDGWRAGFFYDLIERDEDAGMDVSLCGTDQVRFETAAAGSTTEWQARSLVDVPPLVFSEAMRDVDLFVGVTSVAADPDWADRGTERFRDYWHEASFGDLNESAEIRREALQRLLPRTRIADRAELVDRFLLVHGHLRDYKIHLGSGNVVMSPADTYLCIVPARGDRGPKVYLPFEEDGGRLSLIMSKAFLLADDAAITDPSIVAQLRHGL